MNRLEELVWFGEVVVATFWVVVILVGVWQ